MSCARARAGARDRRAEEIERQRPRPRIDVGDGVFELAIGQDRQDRAEDLVLHHAHLVRDVEHERRQKQPRGDAAPRAGRVADFDHARALGAGIVDQARQPREVVVVDDPGVVGVRRDIGIELLGLVLERGDEILDLLLGHEDIVGRHAGLAAIGQLAIGDAARGRAQRKPRSTMTGDLPPSSSVTGTRFSLAARMIARPTGMLPVNSRWSKGRLEKALPTFASPRHDRDLILVRSSRPAWMRAARWSPA